MEKERVMTWELAQTLLDTLCCVAVSANGGWYEEMDFESAEDYARYQFKKILEEWEKLYGFTWKIEVPEEEKENTKILMA